MRRWLGPILAALIVLLGGVVAFWLRSAQEAEVAAVTERAGGPVRSGRLVEPWDRLDGHQWYAARLQRVPVIVPDRPHDPDELAAVRRGSVPMERTRQFHVSTGTMRLRGGDPIEAAHRIVVLGDSTAAGWGVDDDVSWPALLQSRLRERGADVAVLNAGVPANPVAVMALWCERVAPELAPDVVLWVRRPDDIARGPLREYADSARRCQERTGAQLWVVLPPVATFDAYGARRWSQAEAALRGLLPAGIRVVELTGPVRAEQEGRGDALLCESDGCRVVDAVSGEVLWSGPTMEERLPASLLARFETDPELREALFFDDGHLDAEGQRWMAEHLEALLLSAGLP